MTKKKNGKHTHTHAHTRTHARTCARAYTHTRTHTKLNTKLSVTYLITSSMFSISWMSTWVKLTDERILRISSMLFCIVLNSSSKAWMAPVTEMFLAESTRYSVWSAKQKQNQINKSERTCQVLYSYRYKHGKFKKLWHESLAFLLLLLFFLVVSNSNSFGKNTADMINTHHYIYRDL